tara:strand:- start:9 stop:743 length:735 start_codon:yes stop_codon:yes gene_type:complete
LSTNKLKPEQIKAFKEKEAEVFKAAEKEFEEDGFIINSPIEWFADEVFSAGDKEWGLEILQKMEVFAKSYYDLVGTMERLLKLNENDRLLALIKKAEPMIETSDYGISGYYLSLANILLSIDKNRAVELYKKAEEKAVSFMDFISIARNLIERRATSSDGVSCFMKIDVYEGSNHLADKENALRIIHLKCIPLIDDKDHSSRLGDSAQIVGTLRDLGEILEENGKINFNDSIKILANYRKKNNL